MDISIKIFGKIYFNAKYIRKPTISIESKKLRTNFCLKRTSIRQTTLVHMALNRTGIIEATSFQRVKLSRTACIKLAVGLHRKQKRRHLANHTELKCGGVLKFVCLLCWVAHRALQGGLPGSSWIEFIHWILRLLKSYRDKTPQLVLPHVKTLQSKTLQRKTLQSKTLQSKNTAV